jgi:protein phosphatase
MRLGLEGAMLSDAGCVRERNEDCAAYILPRLDDPTDRRCALVVVADGMGGHAAGEVASRLACELVLRTVSVGGACPSSLLRDALLEANAAILAHAMADPSLTGMGTTLTAIMVHDGAAWLGHVGDSRAYLLRGVTLHQLSEDHSLVGELVRRGEISAEAARHHPDRHVIYQALGTHPELKSSVWEAGLPLQAGDIFLLCSDGLTDLLPDEEITAVLQEHEPVEACRELLNRALAAGGHDNVTAGVFRVMVPVERDAEPAPTTRVTRTTNAT